MDKYQAYPQYVTSGVEWIASFPREWHLTRVKFESYVKARVGWHGLKSDDFTDEGPYLVTGSDFKGPVIDWKECYHCDIERYDQDPYIQLKDGDLLITKDGTIGKVALVNNLDGKATLNSGVFVVRPLANNYTSRFYFWLLQSSVFTGFVDHNKTGSTIVHLYQDTFVNFRYAMPSLPEQQKIADFLDHETAKIDTLIDKQQQLITLLKEKRQAVISHAVTKGLNPNAPMRDSGVEWLGEVPAHWSVLSLGKVTLSKCDGPFGSGLKSDHYTESGVRVIRLQNIKMGKYFDGEGAFINEEYYKNNLRNHDVEAGDVLIAGLGDPRNPVGRACIAPDDITPAMVKADCFRFRLDEKKVVPDFIAQQLSASSFHDAGKLSNGSTRARIPLSLMTTRKIAVCSKKEQLQILEHIKQLASQFDRLEEEAGLAIGLMQERRAALISSAVTGKIDVRNWVAPKASNNNKEVAV
tara:strand:- start:21 stop:1421 length:1401 start_codon:yes stop_codon:yes gene_type:complete